MVALWAAATPAGQAATVYRWVDEQGKVHYSDVVPERYRPVARPMDLKANEPTAEPQREALERAQRQKTPAAATSARPVRAAASAASTPVAPPPAGKRPAQVPNEQTDCESWQRLYLESIDCFGPFRTVGGGIKPQAFEVCNVVPEPPPSRCRLRTP